MKKIIQQGAEATIELNDNKIIKNRIKKSYRIKEIDNKIRKSRTKSEAKIINKLENIIPVPKIIKSDDKEQIIMQYIEGKKLSDNLEKLDYKKICKLIAENIAKMHQEGIIHGDLTTSNMIWVEKNTYNTNSLASEESNNNSLIINNKNSAKLLSKRKQLSIINQTKSGNSGDKLFFIDFGLAYHSNKIEDKAVDLHLLQQALEAKHFTIWQECWKIILDNYKPEKYEEIKKRLNQIEKRGRYKDKS
jgi:TP53 regulating kinase and related kinases